MRIWINDHYLPFYKSCCVLKRLDSTVEYIDSFEKWLIENYHGHLVSGEGMAYRQIQTLNQRLNDNTLLFVVVDGLDYLTAIDELSSILILTHLVLLSLYFNPFLIRLSIAVQKSGTLTSNIGRSSMIT